jgi:hypothetical protein
MADMFKSFAKGFSKGNVIGEKAKERKEKPELDPVTGKPVTEGVNKSYKLVKGGRVPR